MEERLASMSILPTGRVGFMKSLSWRLRPDAGVSKAASFTTDAFSKGGILSMPNLPQERNIRTGNEPERIGTNGTN
jgi:hypothetical protein